MAQKILIMGESGSGKSSSLRDCNPETTAIVNPVGKPLPFRGSKHFPTLNGVTDADTIVNFMKEQANKGAKMIVIDDFQYVLAVPYMDRIKETGWDKYNDFGSNYFKIIDVCKELPEDVCVYYLTHCETLENGVTTVKLIGKLLREKITIEGLFTIVLKTGVSEGKYYFFTQNNGKDTVKSPMGMFDSFSIDNDLSYVDAKIRNYYELNGAKSDAEIKTLDEAKAGEVEKPQGRRRRGATPTEETKSSIAEEVKDHFVNVAKKAVEDDRAPWDDPSKSSADLPAFSQPMDNEPKRRRRSSEFMPAPQEVVDEVFPPKEDDLPISEPNHAQPVRRSRKNREVSNE